MSGESPAKQIYLNGYRVGRSIPLAKASARLLGGSAPRHHEYLELRGDILRLYLENAREDQALYLFPYGCVVSVNMSFNALRRLMDALPLAAEHPARLSHHEAHTLRIDGGMLTLFEGEAPFACDESCVPVTANALAKLSALSFMEERISRIYDDAEHFITGMRRGRLRFRAVPYAREIAKLLRFQHTSAFHVRVFERCGIADAHADARRLYDRFMAANEYDKRISILREKAESLGNIFRLLLPLSQNWQESGLLYAEILFLAIFPLFYLL